MMRGGRERRPSCPPPYPRAASSVSGRTADPLAFQAKAREREPAPRCFSRNGCDTREGAVNGLIYLIGLVVVILFILSFLGLR